MLSFGEIFAALGGSLGPAPALVHGDEVVDWQTLHARGSALAGRFLAAGAQPGDRVAHLMRNSPAYLTTTMATFLARMVHVNVNYRYTGAELHHILDNSDASVVVFDAEFADVLEGLRVRLPQVRLWLQVGGSPPDWAEDFADAASGPAILPDQAHRADDRLFIYTGGTTGMPKGVVWEQAALFSLMGGGALVHGGPPTPGLAAHVDAVRAAERHRTLLALPPLMHGTGFLMSIYTLALGGCVITTTGRSFDPAEALALTRAHDPDVCVIVGDVFARPMLRAIEAGAGPMGKVGMMVSSGTMWSPEIKAGLLSHCPTMMCIDALGSSEGLGYGASVSTAADAAAPTRFRHDANTLVVDENLLPVPPGSGIAGRVARGGLMPLCYWKDAAKTAETFIEIDGRRFTMPGDWATVDADGAIVLLGRGSQCINSGGEKIFPEEVEEALKTHSDVEDALVFGQADETWGQAVTAIVEARAAVEETALIAHVKRHLAGYKAPKRILFVAKVPRGPNGKADYAAARQMLHRR